MKKLIFLFLITFSSELFPQTWDFLYKEDFIIYDETYADYGRNFCNRIFIRNDSTFIFRYNSDTLLMIYDRTQKKWFYKSKKDILSNNSSNDSIYKQFKKENFCYATFYKDENIWLNAGENILKIAPDTINNFSQVYDKVLEKYFVLDPFNQDIYDIKSDHNGDVWALARYFVIVSDSDFTNINTLCKYKNERFETVFNREIDRFYIDRLNRIWACYSDSVFVYENEELINKFSTYDFPEGYGYLKEVVFDSKNTMYALNQNSILYVYDGYTFKTDKYMYDIERYAGTHEDLSSCWFCIDSTDNIWLIGGKTCNLYKLDSSGSWSVIDIPKFSTAVDDWCYKYLIECDKKNNIWISAQSFYQNYFDINNYGFYVFHSDTTTGAIEEPIAEFSGLTVIRNVNLYPNPSKQRVTVDFFLEHNVINKCKISLYNTLGMKVKDVTEKIEYDSYNMKATLSFSVSDLAIGAYIIVISAGNSNITRLMLVGL